MGGQIQVISGDGTYEGDAVEAFLQGHDVSKAGVDYTTVAIMGPQSSGKSTLLNAVVRFRSLLAISLSDAPGHSIRCFPVLQFGTDFKMMDAEGGRSQTTQGVWLDLSPKIPGMPTFVLDLEGSDGRERGEDDTTFERQSALFALAMADILMINLFAVNVGRVQGSGAPLLKTVLQVNLKLFLTAPSKNKTVLLIVIRDRTKTPHEKICADMRRDLDTIWASLVKPPEYADSSLEEFFALQYVSLPSYELEEDDFRAECTLLRRRFLPENEGSYIRNDEMKVPASALPLHLKEIWNVIHAQKDLDLPAHKVMVAHIRCRDIATEQLKAITDDVAWQGLLEDAVSGSEITDFSTRSSSLIESCLYGYDTEAMYFVDAVRTEQKEELQKQLFSALQPAFNAQQTLVQNKLTERFATQLRAAVSDPSVRFSDVAASATETLLAEYDSKVQSTLLPVGSPWETGAEGFREVLQASVVQLRKQAIDACEAQVMEEVEAAVDGPAWMTITQMPADLWLQLRSIIKQALKQSVMSIDKELDGYGVSKTDIQALNMRVATALSTKLVKAIRKFLKQLSSALMTKFTTSFEEEGGVRRGWNSDLGEDAARAHKECALALAQLILVPQGFTVPGASEDVFKSSQAHLMEFSNFKQTAAPASVAASPVNGERETPVLLTMMKWSPDVSQEAVLLSPSDVRHIWQDFITSSQQLVRRAKELQDERKRARNRPLPMWVFPALIFFGWNEVVHLLKNPTWLLLSVFLVLFLYQLYHELEVDREMEKGLPAFAINCGRKLVPASKRIIANTGDAIKNLWTGTLTDNSQRAPTPALPQTPPPQQAGEIEMTPMQDSPVQGLHHRKAAIPNPAM